MTEELNNDEIHSIDELQRIVDESTISEDEIPKDISFDEYTEKYEPEYELEPEMFFEGHTNPKNTEVYEVSFD